MVGGWLHQTHLLRLGSTAGPWAWHGRPLAAPAPLCRKPLLARSSPPSRCCTHTPCNPAKQPPTHPPALPITMSGKMAVSVLTIHCAPLSKPASKPLAPAAHGQGAGSICSGRSKPRRARVPPLSIFARHWKVFKPLLLPCWRPRYPRYRMRAPTRQPVLLVCLRNNETSGAPRDGSRLGSGQALAASVRRRWQACYVAPSHIPQRTVNSA